MARDARRPRRSSHQDRKSSTPGESDEEVDELATTPATSNNGANDSDNDVLRRASPGCRPEHRLGNATSAEEALARVVQAGLDAEQLKLLEGARHHLGDDKAREMEQQALQTLEDFVEDEIKNNPGRQPLRKVYVSLRTWISNHQIPFVPITRNLVVCYAHEIFTAPGANWKLEHRKTMLDMLESLRVCANKPYALALKDIPKYGEAFLNSVYDYPEAKALETVDRDLTLDSDVGEPEADEHEGLSSAEEVAQQLTGSQSRSEASRAATTSHQATTRAVETATMEPIKRKRSTTPTSAHPDKNKRQRKQPTPVRVPSPVTAHNATKITDTALSNALGFKRSPRAPLPFLQETIPAQTSEGLAVPADASISSLSVKSGQSIRPTSPSAWERSPPASLAADAEFTAAGMQAKKAGDVTRQVIDLSNDTSDEEMPVDKPETEKQTANVPNDSASQSPKTDQPTKAKAAETTASPSVHPQRKPRPPLYPPSVIARMRKASKQSNESPRIPAMQTTQASPPVPSASLKDTALASDDTSMPRNADTRRASIAHETLSVPPNTASSRSPVLAFNQAVKQLKMDMVARKLTTPVNTPPTATRQPSDAPPHTAQDAEMIPATSGAEETTKVGPSPEMALLTSNGTTALPDSTVFIKSAQPRHVGTTSSVAPTPPLPSGRLQHQPGESSITQQGNAGATDATPASLTKQTSPLVSRPADITKQLSPRPSAFDNTAMNGIQMAQAPGVKETLFDNWDAAFNQLCKAVFAALQRENPKDTVLQINNKVLEAQMAADLQTSANFGWHRNQRRAYREKQASDRGKVSPMNALPPTSAAAPASASVATAMQDPWAATHPVANSASTQSAQIAAPAAGQDQASANTQAQPPQQPNSHLLRPIYPDFLRDIRKPTLITGMLPVYLGPARPVPIASHSLPSHAHTSGAAQVPAPQTSASSSATAAANGEAGQETVVPGSRETNINISTAIPTSSMPVGTANAMLDAVKPAGTAAMATSAGPEQHSIHSQQVTAQSTGPHTMLRAPLFPLHHAPPNYLSTMSASVETNHRADASASRTLEGRATIPVQAQRQGTSTRILPFTTSDESRFTEITSPQRPPVPLGAEGSHTQSSASTAILAKSQRSSIDAQSAISAHMVGVQQSGKPQPNTHQSGPAKPSSISHLPNAADLPLSSSTSSEQPSVFRPPRPQTAALLQTARSFSSQGIRASRLGLGIPVGPPSNGSNSPSNLGVWSPTGDEPIRSGDRRVSAPVTSRSNTSQSPTVPVSGPMRRFSGYEPPSASTSPTSQISNGQMSPNAVQPYGAQQHQRRGSSPYRIYDPQSGKFQTQFQTQAVSSPLGLQNATTSYNNGQQAPQPGWHAASSQTRPPYASHTSAVSEAAAAAQQMTSSYFPPPAATTAANTQPYAVLQQVTLYGPPAPPATALDGNSQPIQSAQPFHMAQAPNSHTQHQPMPLANGNRFDTRGHTSAHQPLNRYQHTTLPLQNHQNQVPTEQQQFQQYIPRQLEPSAPSQTQYQPPIQHRWYSQHPSVQQQRQAQMDQQYAQYQASAGPYAPSNQPQVPNSHGSSRNHYYGEINQQRATVQPQQQASGTHNAQPQQPSIQSQPTYQPASSSHGAPTNTEDYAQSQLKTARMFAQGFASSSESTSISTATSSAPPPPPSNQVATTAPNTSYQTFATQFENMMATQELIEDVAKAVAPSMNVQEVLRQAGNMTLAGMDKNYVNLFQMRTFYHMKAVERQRLEQGLQQQQQQPEQQHQQHKQHQQQFTEEHFVTGSGQQSRGQQVQSPPQQQ